MDQRIPPPPPSPPRREFGNGAQIGRDYGQINMGQRVPPPPPPPPRQGFGNSDQTGRNARPININQQQRPQRPMFDEPSGMPATPHDPRLGPINPLITNGTNGTDPLITYAQWTLSKEKPRYPGQPSTWAIVRRKLDPFDPAELKRVVTKEQGKGSTVDRAFAKDYMTEFKKQQVRRLAQDLNQFQHIPGYEWVVKNIQREIERKSKATTFVHVILKRQRCADPTKPQPRRLPGFAWREVVNLTPEGIQAEQAEQAAAYFRPAMSHGAHGSVYPAQGPINSGPQKTPWSTIANVGPQPSPQHQAQQRAHDKAPEGRPVPLDDVLQQKKNTKKAAKAAHHETSGDSEEVEKAYKGNKKTPKPKSKRGKAIPPIIHLSQGDGFDSDSASSAISENETDSSSGADTDLTPDTLYSYESREHRKEKEYPKIIPKASPRINTKGSKGETRGFEYRQHERPKPPASPVRSAPRYAHEDVVVQTHQSYGGARRRDSLHDGGSYYRQRPTPGHSRGSSYEYGHQFGLPRRRGSMFETQAIKDNEPQLIDSRELDRILTDRELKKREERVRDLEEKAKFQEFLDEARRDVRREWDARSPYGGRKETPWRGRYYDI